MQTADFDYNLPSELIAQTPLPHRDQCRLLALDRRTGAVAHHRFDELPNILQPGDLLVVNDSRVLPARLFGRKPTGGRVEVLLLRPFGTDSWSALTHPGLRVGQTVEFADVLRAQVESIGSDGDRLLRFNRSGTDLDGAIHQIGQLPIPPYVKIPLQHADDYQTVYAAEEGSVAAPTAGLHFSYDLLERLRTKGIEHTSLTLHVGVGTFRPVKVANVAEHRMHAEWFRISDDAATRINRARDEGRRIVAVGTTVVRTLESVSDPTGRVQPTSGDTALFIVPGYQFRCIDALITNFHLPRSTLLMLVSAFAGREHVLAAYAAAVHERYRFYSFGDAMFIS
ncbi:MAG TPA: tRNA preQ1(34) S-adenosylmethionine ribosyltransferase-isomerase QueA [Chloroflexota bacterium]|nr:tRNA preQ1(34) S-adenosylmethionine ribosyltransferase-isomerase QueA [Chloroflexota bacterium]